MKITSYPPSYPAHTAADPTPEHIFHAIQSHSQDSRQSFFCQLPDLQQEQLLAYLSNKIESHPLAIEGTEEGKLLDHIFLAHTADLRENPILAKFISRFLMSNQESVRQWMSTLLHQRTRRKLQINCIFPEQEKQECLRMAGLYAAGNPIDRKVAFHAYTLLLQIAPQDPEVMAIGHRIVEETINHENPILQDNGVIYLTKRQDHGIEPDKTHFIRALSHAQRMLGSDNACFIETAIYFLTVMIEKGSAESLEQILSSTLFAASDDVSHLFLEKFAKKNFLKKHPELAASIIKALFAWCCAAPADNEIQSLGLLHSLLVNLPSKQEHVSFSVLRFLSQIPHSMGFQSLVTIISILELLQKNDWIDDMGQFLSAVKNFLEIASLKEMAVSKKRLEAILQSVQNNREHAASV